MVELWRLPFECVVAAPLRTIDYLFPRATDAAAALEAFIFCMETPLLEHERLFADNPVLSDGIVGMLARVTLAQYRATVNALRQKASVEQDAEWITVHVFSDDFRRHAVELAQEAQDLENWLGVESASGGLRFWLLSQQRWYSKCGRAFRHLDLKAFVFRSCRIS
jgi:hypothetical protein